MATQPMLTDRLGPCFVNGQSALLPSTSNVLSNASFYAHAKWLKPLVLIAKPDFFAADFSFIPYLGEAIDLPEVIGCAADFQDANLARRSFLRNICKIRVSGRRAISVAQMLFTKSVRT